MENEMNGVIRQYITRTVYVSEYLVALPMEIDWMVDGKITPSPKPYAMAVYEPCGERMGEYVYVLKGVRIK